MLNRNDESYVKNRPFLIFTKISKMAMAVYRRGFTADLFSSVGWEYGVSAFYLIPAIISLAHLFYPTMLSWIIVTFLYFIWALFYILAVLLDLYKKIRSLTSSALFVDFSDTVIFLVFTLCVTLISLGLLLAKPKIKEY